MKRKQTLLVRALVLATLLVGGIALAQDGGAQSPAAPAEALTTGFTYQGRLDQNGSPGNDTCDMRFKLYDAASMGTQVGSTINTAVPIANGLFTVDLDFGAGAFNGDRRWLGIEVDCEEDSTYADLGRQELTAAPYALHAMSAPWSGLAGVPSGFADGVDDDTTYTAGEGLVLDGTEFSAQGSPYANVIIVAKSGGDYSSVQTAIDSITDATAGNLYLVWVAPGVYVEQVTMKPYIHLQGAGQEATVITNTVAGSGSPLSQATLVLTRSTSLRDLTVGNGGTGSQIVALLATDGTTRTQVADVTAQALGGGGYNYAVYLAGSGTDVTLQHVTGLAEGGSYNRGLHNHTGADVVVRGGSFTARGGTNPNGISNTGSGTTLEATDVTVLAESGSSINCGLYNDASAEAVLRGGSFTGRGGTEAYGITNHDSVTLEAEGITALGENGSDSNFGLYNYEGSEATLRVASFTGREGADARGITNDGSSTTLEAVGVTALGENGNYNQGLYNSGGSDVVLRSGSYTGRGGTSTSGIYNGGSGMTLEATSVTALGENGSDYNTGLLNFDGATAVLHGGSFIGRGGTQVARGIYNSGISTTLEATSVTALAEDGGESHGLHNTLATVEADSSRFAGTTNGLYRDGGWVYLGVTQLDGGADWFGGGALICFQVYDENYAPYTCP